MRTKSWMSWLPLILVAFISPPRVAVAQDQPVVFVHGLKSDGGAWADVAARLAGSLRIKSYTPSLSSSAYYETQSSQLSNALTGSGLGSNTIAVGHSNGGVVSRYLARVRPFRGTVTMGSPNFGAPLVTNAPYIVTYGAILLYNVFSLSDVIWSRYGEQWRWLQLSLSGAMAVTNGLGTDLQFNILGWLGLSSGTVLGQMVPGSSFLTTLNNATSQAGTKVAVSVVATNYYYAAPWRAFMTTSSADNMANNMGWAAAIFLSYANDLITNGVPIDYQDWTERQQIANHLNHLVALIFGIDRNWCYWVNGGTCGPSDDVVPLWSQLYNGALARQMNGPGHMREIPESYSMVRTVLNVDFGVPAR
jgi:pimeloyl-ACP methyl ester carboxylesterase